MDIKLYICTYIHVCTYTQIIYAHSNICYIHTHIYYNIDSKEIEGGRYIGGCDGNLCFREKEKVKSGRIIWNES